MLAAEDAFARAVITWQAVNEGAVSEAITQLRRRKGKPTAREVAELAAEIKANLSSYPEIIQRAEDYGNKILLTEEAPPYIRKWFDAIDAELKGGFRPAKLIAPFKGVPTNMARLGAVYGPGGFVNLAFKGKNLSRYDQNMLAARAIVGTVIIGGLYALAASGGIEMEGEAPEGKTALRNLEESTGRRAWSIRIGNTWFSLQDAGPLAPALYAVASALNAGESSPLIEGFRGMWAGLMDASFMHGVNTFLSALQEGGAWVDIAAANVAGQLVPGSGLLGNISNATDPLRRDTSRSAEDSTFGPIGRRLAARIPGVRQALPPKIDPLGRPVRQQPTGWRAFIPAAGTPGKHDDPVVEEMLRIGYAPGYVGRSFQQDRKSYALTKSQWADYQQQAGQAVYDALEGLFESETYKALPDDEERRIEAMKAAERARKPVREEFRGKIIPAEDQPEMQRRRPQRKRAERLERVR